MRSGVVNGPLKTGSRAESVQPDVTSGNGTESSQLYESGQYELLNPGWHVDESAWKARAILSMLRRNHVFPSTICDAGCGVGEVLAQLQSSLDPGVLLHGYDISPHAVDRAMTRANSKLHFFLGNIPDGAPVHYDLLLIVDVLEHIGDYFEWARNLHSHADLTMFHLPLDLTYHRVARPRALTTIRRRYGHLHFFNRELALQTVRDLGFEVLDWMYTEEFRVSKAEGLRAAALRIPREMLYRISPDACVRAVGGCRLLILAR